MILLHLDFVGELFMFGSYGQRLHDFGFHMSEEILVNLFVHEWTKEQSGIDVYGRFRFIG